jgi:hypothetical protein
MHVKIQTICVDLNHAETVDLTSFDRCDSSSANLRAVAVTDEFVRDSNERHGI